jgi:hypothetical protein
MIISYGDLADWQGFEVCPIPEWGYELEVLPDDEAAPVETRRGHLGQARQVLQRSPPYLATFDPPATELPDDAEGPSRIAFALVTTLKSELPEHWRSIRALELCIDEVKERLGGEDSADPVVREALENAKATVREVVAGLAECRIEAELVEPEESDLALVRRCWTRRSGGMWVGDSHALT